MMVAFLLCQHKSVLFGDDWGSGISICHDRRSGWATKVFEENEKRHEVIPYHPALRPFRDTPSAKVAGQMTMCRDYFFGHFFTS